MMLRGHRGKRLDKAGASMKSKGLRSGWRSRLATLVSCLSLLNPQGVQAQDEFRRGVNLSHWFEHEGRTPVSAQELAALHGVGFDHVRIPVDPKRLGWDPPRRHPALHFASVDQAIDQALHAGLDVIVDIAPDPRIRQSIEDDRAVFDSYADMLQALASNLKQFPGNRIALELLNEPQFYGWRSGQWQALEARLITSVRAQAPNLTLIAMGRMGGSLEGLAALDPYSDPQVIYSFHFYLPYLFTHQGAPWLAPNEGTTAALFRHVLYPSDLARLSPPTIVPAGPFAQRAHDEFAKYIGESWNSNKIAERLLAAEHIAHDRGIRVICDEFGAIREGVDAPSRMRWLRDVRKALEQDGIGWTVWDYADDFGVAPTRTSNGRLEIDPGTLEALGLSGDHR
jgi:endoglucanase